MDSANQNSKNASIHHRGRLQAVDAVADRGSHPEPDAVRAPHLREKPCATAPPDFFPNLGPLNIETQIGVRLGSVLAF